jgi:transcriptional regulator with XRE-family HTH domain
MTCIRCGEPGKKTHGVHTFRRTIDGCSFVADVKVEVCSSCEEPSIPVAATLAFDRAIAIDLARRGPVTGNSFRFIRKAAGLQPVDLSRLLGVTLETVNRWEAGRREIDLSSWLVTSAIALETFGISLPMHGRIEALRGKHVEERRLDLGFSEERPRHASATAVAVVHS